MSPSLAALRLQCTPRQIFQTGYGGRIRTYVNEFQRLAPFQFGHSVRILELVDLARLERATSTFAESRSDSAELQVRMNWYGHPRRGVSDPSFLAPNLPAARVYDSDSGNGGDGAIRTLTGFLPAP